MIDFNKDKARMIDRKDINEQRKRAKIVKSKKGQNYKNISYKYREKEIIEKRREKVLQNAKDRKLAKANPLVALQASVRANRASNDTQSITNTDDAVIGNDNTDAIIGDDNTDAVIGDDNTDVVIVTENTDNAAIDVDNTDNATIDADNTDNNRQRKNR